jgi:predicted acyl esterase
MKSHRFFLSIILILLIMSAPFFYRCSGAPTDVDMENRQATANELESMPYEELAQYISEVDGEEAAEQTAAPVSVFEILKVAALIGPGEFTYTENISIISFDGVKISANVYAPKNMGPGPFPAVVFINSYGMDEYEYQVPAATLAKKGYVALSYSARGFGKSGGMVNFGGSNDTADMTAVLDYLASHFPVDRDNIAAAGISYGGMSALLALAKHDRIKTAVCMSGPADFYRGLFNQDASRTFWINFLKMGGFMQVLDPAFGAMLDDVMNYRNIPAFRTWAASISPASYISQINARGNPVYISHNFSDDLLMVNANIDFFTRLTVPKKLDLNQGVHASAEAGGVLGAPNYVWNNAYRWLDYHLKGIDTGIMGEPSVTMERKFDSGRDSFETWPSSRVRNTVFYLHPRKNILDYDGEIKASRHYLSTLFNPNGNATNRIEHLSLLPDTIATTGIPAVAQLLESHVDVPVKVLIDFISPAKGIVFRSDRFDNGLKIRGVPKLCLNVAFSGGKGLLAAYLYDVDDLGVGTLLTHGILGSYNRTAGQRYTLNLEFAATAYDLPAGHRLAVVIDTADPLYGQPADGYYNVNFSFSNSLQSTFTVPTVQ